MHYMGGKYSVRKPIANIIRDSKNAGGGVLTPLSLCFAVRLMLKAKSQRILTELYATTNTNT